MLKHYNYNRSHNEIAYFFYYCEKVFISVGFLLLVTKKWNCHWIRKMNERKAKVHKNINRTLLREIRVSL